MRRIRAAATARLAAVEPAGDVLRATLTTARQWLHKPRQDILDLPLFW